MMKLPENALICEVGPRDGFQYETKWIPTDQKLAVIQQLLEAGVQRIQVTAFVHPKWVPQMADAEELCRRLPQRDGVVFSGLALNLKGVERAHAAGLRYVDLSIATHDEHSLANANMTVAEAIQQAEAMIRLAHHYDMQPQLGLQTVFGYRVPGDTPLRQVRELARRFVDLGLESFSLADTTGMANPLRIQEYVQAVQEEIGDTPLVLHLHDTRGLGLANVLAALQCGVRRFDTSVGGLGGCPFIPGATGNIATEDTVYLLEAMGVRTGIDYHKVAALALELEAFLGKLLPSHQARLLSRQRKQTSPSHTA
jgi:hydroxymethylglutaryl-CoA lyase